MAWNRKKETVLSRIVRDERENVFQIARLRMNAPPRALLVAIHPLSVSHLLFLSERAITTRRLLSMKKTKTMMWPLEVSNL